MQKEELLAYAAETLGDEAEYLWERLPDCCVLRHAQNGKWYAVMMPVARRKLGLAGDGKVTVVNFKCGPILSGSYREKPGVLPAYHMSRANWVSVLLDGTASRETVLELLGISYDLTRQMPRRGAKAKAGE